MKRRPSVSHIPCVLAFLLLTTFFTVQGSWAGDSEGLPDYWGESTWLTSAPGVSDDLAAGLFNPAAYSVVQDAGFYLGWRNNRELGLYQQGRAFTGESNDFTGILSLHNLSFSYQRFDLKDDFRATLPGAGDLASGATDEYSLSLSSGDRSHSSGLAYTWSGGDRTFLPRHKRLTMGILERGSHLSLGMAGNWDLENGDLQGQADLGVRPWGNRVTFYGEIEATAGRSLAGGYGVEGHLFRGLRLSARYRDGGRLSVGLALSFGPTRLIGAGHGDGDGSNQESYALQVGGQREPALLPSLDEIGGSRRKMEWNGPMPYRRYRLFDERRTFLSALTSIARASESPAVHTLVLNLSGMRVRGEQLWELRQQLEAAQERGKRVVIYADRLGLFLTMLATVADDLWLDPQGNLDLRGISWGKTYYRRALDKLGLGVEEWRFFKYKSAYEVLSRTHQSEADREQRQLLIDDYYEEARAAIAASRGLSPEAFDTIVDTRGYVTPAEALELGLVDHLGSFDDAMKAAKKAEAAAREPGPDGAVDTVLGDPVWGGLRWGEPDEIAVLYAIGECSMDSGIDARRLSKEIEKARKNRKVKAVVLRVDSPGGDPLASDLVARQLLETMKVKPVIISQGNVAASGGYWISMYSHALVASPITLTGSIGVIGGWIWDEGFGDRIGFDYSQVKRGRHADMGGGIQLPFLGATLPARPLDDDEHARMEKVIRGMYADFVSQVARGRKMSETAVDSIAQGRVWSGRRGKEIGLVDELGGLWRAIELAKEKAGIPAGEGVKLVEGPSLGWINPELFKLSFGFGSGASEFDPLSGDLRQPFSGWMGLSSEEFEYLRAVFGHPGRPVLRTPPVQIHEGSQGE